MIDYQAANLLLILLCIAEFDLFVLTMLTLYPVGIFYLIMKS